jgi:hypothetical protein
MRVPGEIDSKAVCGAETGAFTDEYDCEGGSEAFADFIADGDPALLDDYDWGHVPVGGGQEAERCFEQIGRVALDCESRKSVSDDKRDVVLSGYCSLPAAVQQEIPRFGA